MNCIIRANKKSCELLEEYVGKSTSLNLVGSFFDLVSVQDQLSKRQDIDLVFLDIEISEMDVFNYIKSLNYKPNIIIVSSGDQSALKAFDFNVVDYLLKPVTYPRFCKAVDKAIRYYSPKEARKSDDNEIFVKKGSSLVRLNLKDILYIEALENYITLKTKEEKFTIHFTMKAIETQLPSSIFIRVHRSYIVNKNMIQTIKENSLELSIGDELKNIPLGNSFRDSLLNHINVVSG
jgi:DNA-binding LytR/AlgR family response regulator